MISYLWYTSFGGEKDDYHKAKGQESADYPERGSKAAAFKDG